MTRPKLDSSVPPAVSDFLFEEIEPDVAQDPLEQFVSDASCAGAFSQMSSDVARRHVDALAEESAERNGKFAKRFGARPPEPGAKLEKAAQVAARVETKNGWRLEYDRYNELLRAFEVRE